MDTGHHGRDGRRTDVGRLGCRLRHFADRLGRDGCPLRPGPRRRASTRHAIPRQTPLDLGRRHASAMGHRLDRHHPRRNPRRGPVHQLRPLRSSDLFGAVRAAPTPAPALPGDHPATRHAGRWVARFIPPVAKRLMNCRPSSHARGVPAPSCGTKLFQELRGSGMRRAREPEGCALAGRPGQDAPVSMSRRRDTFCTPPSPRGGGNWDHTFHVTVATDGGFTGTNEITGLDAGQTVTVNETVSGQFTDKNNDGVREITLAAVRPNGFYTFNWSVTDAPMDGVVDSMTNGTTSYVTALDWNGGELPI